MVGVQGSLQSPTQSCKERCCKHALTLPFPFLLHGTQQCVSGMTFVSCSAALVWWFVVSRLVEVTGSKQAIPGTDIVRAGRVDRYPWRGGVGLLRVEGCVCACQPLITGKTKLLSAQSFVFRGKCIFGWWWAQL